MLRKKALKKIFVTTLTMFIILTIYTIPTTENKKVLRTNLEIEDITNLSTDKIYLLNKDNYLVKTDVFIDSNKTEEKIEKIINYLTIDNSKIPITLNGYIPKNTKLLDYNLDEKYLFLNFSKELEESKNKDIMITGIVYSLLELNNIDKITILIEGEEVKEYINLDKKIGINKEYLYTNRNNIEKVVVYYLDNDDLYYVPVTKYLNNDKNKIEVIIDELKNTNKSLISYLNNNAELLDYKEEANVLFLDFNEYLLDSNEEVTDKILNTIAYSVFDNYDVGMVMFEVNGKKLKYIEKK